MDPSERVTWEDCPACRRAAAVGWVNGRPVVFDCPGGCRLSTEQVGALASRRGRPPAGWLARVSERLADSAAPGRLSPVTGGRTRPSWS